MGSWLVRHWLELFIVGVGVFAALPILAPVLAAAGHETPARVIYLGYRVTCHQLPHRSWFIGGRSATYDWETVRAYLELEPGAPEALAFHRPITDPELGYQVAYCQRDFATWLALFVVTVAYAAVRRRRRVPALPFKVYVLALVPLAIDGVGQLLGLRESTAVSRTITGALFGGATGLFVLPMLGAGMADIALSQQARCSPRVQDEPA